MVSCTNERTTAIAMSSSRSALRQNDTPIATAISASVPATWASEMCVPVMPPRLLARSTACASCGHGSRLDPDGPRRQPLRLRAIMRDEDDRDPLAELPEGPLDRIACRLIQRGRGLVQQQHL